MGVINQYSCNLLFPSRSHSLQMGSLVSNRGFELCITEVKKRQKSK